MSRIDLSDLTNLENQSTATGAINANNETLEEIMDNALFRNGEAPNHMLAELDMNSNPIINLPAAVNPGDAVRVIDLPSLIPDFAQGQLDIDAAEQAAQDAQNAAAQAINAANSIDVGTLGIQDADTVAISGGIIANTSITGVPAPQVAADVSNKQYADKQNPENARILVRAATTTSLTGSPTYTAATSTTTAILEATINGSLSIDGVTINDGDRVLVKDQATALHNDVYIKSTVASHWKLTGASDIDTSLKGEVFYVDEGSTNAGKVFARTGNTPNFYGDTVFAFTNTDFATQGQLDVTNRNITANTAAIANINLTVPTPTPTTLGGVKSLAAISHQFLTSIGTDGLSTQAQPSSSDISGLATSATIDTTNASNISSGTLPDARLNATISPATVGDSSHVPVITFDSHGRLTSVVSQAIGSSSFTIGIVSPGINSVVGNDGTDRTTIASVITAGGEIHFYPGVYLINDNTTWPSGKTYVIHPGAYIKVSTSKKLIINGQVIAGHYKIFGTSASGFDLDGTVVGVTDVKPVWWGLVHNDATKAANNYLACESARACGEDVSIVSSYKAEQSYEFSRGIWYLDTTLTFNPTTSINWKLKGFKNNTILVAKKSGFSGVTLLRIKSPSAASTDCDFDISDLIIVNEVQDSAVTCGLIIGPDTGIMNGSPVNNRMSGLKVSGFDQNIRLQNCRLMSFNRCSAWSYDLAGTENIGSTGLLITTGGSDHVVGTWTSFCGDNDFTECVFVCPYNGGTVTSGVGIDLNDLGNANSHISANRFHSCIVYYGAKHLELKGSGTNSQIDDTWFVDGQFEGGVGATGVDFGIGVYGECNNGTTILDIHVLNTYFVGSGHYKDVQFKILSGGGNFQGIFISGNWHINSFYETYDLRAGDALGNSYGSAYNINICNNIIRDPNGSTGSANSAIYIENITSVIVGNNSIYSSSGGNTRTNFVKFTVGGNYFSAIGNNSGGRVTSTIINNTVGGSTATTFTGNNI